MASHIPLVYARRDPRLRSARERSAVPPKKTPTAEPLLAPASEGDGSMTH